MEYKRNIAKTVLEKKYVLLKANVIYKRLSAAGER